MTRKGTAHLRTYALTALGILLLGSFLLSVRTAAQTPAGASPHRSFGIPCMNCHTTESWKTIKKSAEFDHKLTGYVLNGRHASVPCASCHGAVSFKDLKKDCLSCHKDFHKGEFGNRCRDCHTPAGWRAPNEQVAKHQLTRFPLLGAHAAADCAACHATQQTREYAGTPTDCYECHKAEYAAVGEPDHAKNNFDHQCARCHDAAAGSWSGSFTHPPVPFMSTPAHLRLACGQCHTSGYRNTPTDCYGCHQRDYASVKQPDHAAGSFDRNCTVCHDPVHWKPARFDHNKSGFPLQGAHAATPCAQCHTSGYGKLPKDCWSCHQNDYRGTTFPNHAQGQFSQQCTDCHTLTAWKPAAFKHDNTNFPLTGAHRQTFCEKCHIGGKYSGLPLDCQGCHEQNFLQTSKPKHDQVGFTRQCALCHNTTAWQPVETMPRSIDHNRTRFPLEGAHAAVACDRCHVNKVFGGTPTECFVCHERDFRGATNPDHAAGMFEHDCLSCHTMAGWKPATFDHGSTKFPLRGAHSTVPCANCHVGGNYRLAYTDCWQCHEKDYTASLQPAHVKAQFPHDCTRCHTETAWKPATLDHAKTQFPLRGAHAAVPCESCHPAGAYTGRPLECAGCHQPDYDKVTAPDHKAGQFPRECWKCHSETAWKPALFDHATTRFPLQGAHTAAPCQDCHTNGVFTGTPMDCWSCHKKDFDAVVTPSHVSGQFDHDCTRCHGNAAWKPSTVNHDNTRFPLLGKHKTAACEQCHINGKYSGMATDCWSCHEKNYTGVTQPNHVQGQFNHDCTMCHGVDAWKPTRLDHDRTRFPLTGLHRTVACEKCHTNGQYGVPLPTDCFTCHQTTFQQTRNPDHTTGQFPHSCQDCHTTAGWKPASFDHTTTKFPLEGAHRAEPCQSCHVNGNYTLTYTDCFQCHERDFTATRTPDHTAARFDHDCTKCHGVSAWKPSTFNHATTKFPLTGAHSAEPCQSCHINGNYSLTYTDCAQCHLSDYNATTAPNHSTAQFPRDCQQCHTVSAWKPSTFDHTSTNFRLEGAHNTVPCQSCHTNGNYTLKYTDCLQCHQQDFSGAKQPDHTAGGFPRDCKTCHTNTAWKPATFDHAATAFPLTGRHQTEPCQSCHTNGNYTLKYTDCFACHTQEFNTALTPNHVSSKFSHDCSICHTTSAWKPSVLDHNKTRFPLSGKHTGVACERCHVNGNYQLTYTDCAQCHNTDFVNAKNPDHTAGKFPNDCTKCHSSNGWKPATFSHGSTAFPLEGAHTPLACERCHINGNYQLTYTGCYTCHSTSFQQTKTPDHVAGQFSHDCLKCHTQISYKPSTFNHNSTAFPLQGGHVAVPCQQCHVNGNYTLKYQDCWQCHQTTFNATTNPSHSAGQFSHDCLSCHTQSAWKPATFDHATTAFPLQGAHQSKPCQDCHVGGNYQLVYSGCITCHQSAYNSTTNPAHVTNQFPTTCLTCHTQITWTPSTFSHAATNFPLQGAHQAQPCNACHTNGNYTLTYTDCWQCHQSDYQSVTNPNHVTAQFSHTCTQCHTQSAWKPSTFNHANTAFPLAGAHIGKPCADCHINGNYSLTYTGCWQCHQSDFTGATTPANHSALNLSHTCTTCHTQTAWSPATPFRTSHNVNAPTGFPIYTGSKHAYPNRWSNCNQCHTTNVTSTFCCTGCHNNQSSLNGDHQGVSGYTYNCTACANSGCHPDGREP
ncbi:MAG: hypothetical protein HY962_06575 [Ignavibacteriae bacterium]|nr:hypothetical protein [Ignavibacteriota bacterium]